MTIRIPIVSKFDPKGVGDAETSFKRLSGTLSTVGGLMAGALAIGAVGIGMFAADALKAADNSEKIGRGLENAIKNAGVFGSTQEDISKATDALQDHAKMLGELIGIDDEVLLSIERTWMAVPELAGLGTEGIKNLAKVTADVAAGTGKDIESIGTAFIKIAGDEETALSKLTRQGIVFTDAQKEQYNLFLENNDQIGAQAYLVETLGTTYSGAAEAMASPLDRMNQMWENLSETIGVALLPAAEELSDKLGKAIADMVAKPEFAQFLSEATDFALGLVQGLVDFSTWWGDNQALIGGIAIAIGAIAAAIGVLNIVLAIQNILLMANPITWIVLAIVAALALVIAAIYLLATNWDAIVKTISKAWGDMVYGIQVAWTNVVNGIIGGVNFVITAFNGLLDIWNMLTGSDFNVDLMATVSAPTNPNAPANRGRDGNGGFRLAAGGVVLPRPGGTLATIGEAGQAEAVIPLDRLDRMMGNRGGGATYVVNVNGGLATSADVGRAVVEAIKRYERTSGPVFVGA